MWHAEWSEAPRTAIAKRIHAAFDNRGERLASSFVERRPHRCGQLSDVP